jgi:hypothetical protein
LAVGNPPSTTAAARPMRDLVEWIFCQCIHRARTRRHHQSIRGKLNTSNKDIILIIILKNSSWRLSILCSYLSRSSSRYLACNHTPSAKSWCHSIFPSVVCWSITLSLSFSSLRTDPGMWKRQNRSNSSCLGMRRLQAGRTAQDTVVSGMDQGISCMQYFRKDRVVSLSLQRSYLRSTIQWGDEASSFNN